MKTKFYYFLGDQLGGRSTDPDRLWWPEDANEIEVDMGEAAKHVIDNSQTELLGYVAELVMVAEYDKSLKGWRSNRMVDDDDLIVYVSTSRDVVGTMFKTTLRLEPSAVAYLRQPKKPVRLPNAEELAEAAS